MIQKKFKRLELYKGRFSSTVLIGEKGSNPPDLPDNIPNIFIPSISLLFLFY